MDKCQNVQGILADYRTGLLSDGKRGWVEAHVAECPACARELEILDQVLAMVDENTPAQEPPAGLWNGVANRITSRGPARPNWLAKPLKLAGAGAAAFAIILGVVLSAGPRTVVPVRVASSNEYVQGHAFYAGQAPLADHVGYLAMVSADEAKSR